MQVFSGLWALALRPGFGGWLQGGCCWSTLATIHLTSSVRDFRVSEIRESWYEVVGFCWPVIVLYRLAARTGM